MFYQILLLSQVKRCVIITYKHSIYKLPPELPNDSKGLKRELSHVNAIFISFQGYSDIRESSLQ